MGFKPKFTPPTTPQVNMSLSGVPLDNLNVSSLSSSPMTILKQPPKCLNDTYEGLISPIHSDYGIINDDTFHPSYNKNESNQSKLGVVKDDEGEGDLSAVNLPSEMVSKTHHTTPFMPLQVKTQSSSHKGSLTH
jgi:hypothetical protein